MWIIKNYRQENEKRETIYATYSLGRKLAQGVGVSIVSFLLILTGYDENLGHSRV
ncbi:hypothetical protein MYD03_00050 [Mediterraneibacter gnavus]